MIGERIRNYSDGRRRRLKYRPPNPPTLSQTQRADYMAGYREALPARPNRRRKKPLDVKR